MGTVVSKIDLTDDSGTDDPMDDGFAAATAHRNTERGHSGATDLTGAPDGSAPPRLAEMWAHRTAAHGRRDAIDDGCGTCQEHMASLVTSDPDRYAVVDRSVLVGTPTTYATNHTDAKVAYDQLRAAGRPAELHEWVGNDHAGNWEPIDPDDAGPATIAHNAAGVPVLSDHARSVVADAADAIIPPGEEAAWFPTATHDQKVTWAEQRIGKVNDAIGALQRVAPRWGGVKPTFPYPTSDQDFFDRYDASVRHAYQILTSDQIADGTSPTQQAAVTDAKSWLDVARVQLANVIADNTGSALW